MSKTDFHPESMAVDELDDDDATTLSSMCEAIRRPLAANCPASHPVRRAIEFCFHGDLVGIKEETEKFHRAWRMWTQLPATEQQRILGGWLPDPEPPTKEGMIEYLTELTGNIPIGGLCITGGRFGISASMDWWLSEGIEPVIVNIHRGITKTEALHHLERIAAHLDEHWPTLISKPDEVTRSAP